jgi:hypothetical protein
MVSSAVACLPAAVSLLLLEVLFMQISGVSLALTWPHRLCLLRVLLCGSLCCKLSTFQVHWERWHCTRVVRPMCLFTVHVGGGSSPLSCGVFLPPPLSQAFFLLITGWCCCSCQPPCLQIYNSRGKWVFPPLLWTFPPFATLTSFPAPGWWVHTPTPTRASPACQACLFTVLGRIPFPQSSAFSVPHPLSRMSLLFLLLISQFLFFPWVEVSLSRGLCCSGPGLSVGVPHTAKLTCSLSSQAVWVWVTGGPGALLVSPFNVKWRFSAPAGGVEGSTLCLFSVIMPAKCVSSVSPRFHYRSLTFCFLHLAAILESLEIS